MLGFEFMLHYVSWPVDSFVVQNCCSSSVLEVGHLRLYQYMIMQITYIVSFNKFSWNLFLLSCRINLSFSSLVMFYRCIGHSLHSCRFELMLCSKWWFGIVVVHWFGFDQPGYFMSGQLVLGWVTVIDAGKPSRYVTSHHPGQRNLTIPSWLCMMSTSDINRHTIWYTSPISMVTQHKLMAGWGLQKRRLEQPCGPVWLGNYFTFLHFTLYSKNENQFSGH